MLRPTISTGSSSKKTTHKYSNLEVISHEAFVSKQSGNTFGIPQILWSNFNNLAFQKPSIHGIVFAAKLSQINVRIAPIDGSNSGGISSTPVQDLWERSFKELGEENPEQLVSGLLLFYPCQLVGYLEVFQYLSRLSLQKVLLLYICRATRKEFENASKFWPSWPLRTAPSCWIIILPMFNIIFKA